MGGVKPRHRVWHDGGEALEASSMQARRLRELHLWSNAMQSGWVWKATSPRLCIAKLQHDSMFEDGEGIPVDRTGALEEGRREEVEGWK